MLTVGTFDGIHRGHRYLFDLVKKRAAEQDALSVMMTFEPHPQLVIRQGQSFLDLLTTIEEKINILENVGLDVLVITNFTKAFATLEAEQFIKNMLVDGLNTQHIIIGKNHFFGRDRRGNYQLLQELESQFGYKVEAVDPLVHDGHTVSSSRIRHLLTSGNVETATELLGRPYSVTGRVVHGKKVGQQLGFPTANVRPYSRYKLIPQVGIYATRIRIDSTWYDSVTYIGHRPTFDGEERLIEVHIFDWDKDLYDKNVQVTFLKFIRAEEKFSNRDELIAAISTDTNQVKTFFAQGGFN